MNDDKYIFQEECCKNFHSAWSILDELEKINCESRILKSAAYRMALVEYCKSYKKSFWSDRKDKSGWDLPAPNYLSKSFFEIHEKIIESRDKFLVHADLDEKEPELIKDCKLIMSNSTPPLPSLSDFKQLLEKTIEHIELEQNKYRQL